MERKDLPIAVLVVATAALTGIGSELFIQTLHSIGDAINRQEADIAYSIPDNRRFLNPDSLMTGESRLEDATARKTSLITPPLNFNR